MADALCLGEILVDWVCTKAGLELDKADSFTKAAGGAPANVAVGLARQGVCTAFIGRVSADQFGLWLKAVLEADGIDTSGTVVDAESHTRMAYVVTTGSGDRKLAEFSRVSVADSRLHRSDLKEQMFRKAKLLHFGSISLIEEPAADATRFAVELAKNNGLLISYDPNVRLGLWPSPEVCKRTILETLHLADIVKINLDELEFLTGSRELGSAMNLQQRNEIKLLIVTLDSSGAFFSTAAGHEIVPGFKIDFVEATGAGDGFVAGVLTGVLSSVKDAKSKAEALSAIPLATMHSIVQRANAIGALACTKPGAIPALPTNDDVKTFLKTMKAPSSASFRL